MNLAEYFGKVTCTGDIPSARSGHAVIALNDKYLLLHGGIDYSEEAVYNDFYILNFGEHVYLTLYVLPIPFPRI